MDHASFLRAIGGSRVAGEIVGVTARAAQRWGNRGIPPVYWRRLVHAAIDRGISVTLEDLEAARPPPAYDRNRPKRVYVRRQPAPIQT